MNEQPASTFLDLPFSIRWRKELAHAMNVGGWHVHAAGSQNGKTTANLQFREAHAPVRVSGGTTVPVALAWAAQGRRPLLRSLALSLGGETFARMSGRETRVPAAMAKCKTRLIIINNAHNMDWRQWQELLTLDDVCLGSYSFRPAIVFSGIYATRTLPDLPRRTELNEQIKKRVTCFKAVRGHDKNDVQAALEVLLEAFCPPLLRERAANHAAHVFDLLTRPEIDFSRSGYVATGDLLELTRRMAALRNKDPQLPVPAVIESAFDHYQRHRRDIVMKAA